MRSALKAVSARRSRDGMKRSSRTSATHLVAVNENEHVFGEWLQLERLALEEIAREASLRLPVADEYHAFALAVRLDAAELLAVFTVIFLVIRVRCLPA